MNNQVIIIKTASQHMACYAGARLHKSYAVSTAKNGVGEQSGSECTPRGWHSIHRILGLENAVNSVFVGRVWTGEIYDAALALANPLRDWILTRILQLEGLELGVNKGDNVDSLSRYIYIHGTPDTTPLGVPLSHGCIRMRNSEVMELADWAHVGTRVYIE